MITVQKDIERSFVEQNGKDFVFYIKSDFVAFRGHFPGQPLLPGIVQIEIALFCIRNLLNSSCANVSEISKVKFTKPVLPETKITISVEQSGEIWKTIIKDDKDIYSQIQMKIEKNF